MPVPGEAEITRWKVGNFHFDANNHRLRGEGRDVLLEPKPSALLAYFCQNPGRSIGRDELLSAVWHGQIVSDNSISRVIVLLRKALRDDDKTRRYISTIPKLGYRLIADVSGIEKPPANQRAVSHEPIRRFALRQGLIGGGVLLGLFVALFLTNRDPAPIPDTDRAVVPLSRLAVTQTNGHLASDGQRLVYTANDGTFDVVYLIAEAGAEPVPISAPGGHANFATWAHGDEFVVYQFMDGDRCEFHRIEPGQFSARRADVLYQCLPGSYSELSLSRDNATLYFLERASPYSPYAVYALDLARQTKQRPSQPVPRGYGNHYVDVHPERGVLLLLSDHAPGKTSVFELDPAAGSFALRRAFDYGLDSAIWSHREDHVVHPSRHPSYQLLESSLADETSRVIVSDSRRISTPRRINDGHKASGDYLFTSYLYNRDIELAGVPTESINSAVMDYLPSLSHSGDALAFISKRSGESQIWVKNLSEGSLLAIKPPDLGRRFHDLAWSADDRQLLASTNTGILVYDLGEGAFVHDVALSAPVYGVHWADEQTLAFSQYENDQWRAYLWRLDQGQAKSLAARWAFSLQNGQQQIFFDQELVPFRDGRELTVLQECAHPLWRYQLRLHLDGTDLYCHAADTANDLLRLDAELNVDRLPD
ncbi:MAG: winged helix-turn-helix domain-containing protein, partial [Pseudomonadota bacterium]